MSAPSRFPNGLGNSGPTSAMAQLPIPDLTKHHVFLDDFDTTPIAAQWTLTATSVGAGTSAITVPDADGGLARITTAANENDGIFAEWISETFLVEEGKKLWMKARLQVGDAIESDLIIGLHSTDTTPLDATHRFAFISEDGSAALFFNVDDNTTDADSATLATLADDTFITLGLYYDGKGTIQLFVDDALKDTMSSVGVPSGELAVGFGYLNGAAGAETTDIDYLMVVKER